MAIGKAKGLAGVHQRAEEIASSRQTFGLRKFTQEFRWDGNKSAAENQLTLRILGDDLIVPTKQHRGVKLPEGKFFFGICRKAEPIEADFCYVCDVLAKNFEGDQKQRKREGLIPVDIAVGLAVEMESIGKGRNFQGYQPKMVEFQIPDLTESEKKDEATPEEKEYRALLDGLGKPGEKVNVPHIGLMVGTISGDQALWDYAIRRPEISDRVYEISRHGKALETRWTWDHEGQDREMPDPAPLLAEYAAKYPFELPIEYVERNSSQDRYDFFFKLKDNAEGDGEAASSDSDDEVQPVSDSRAALMEKLRTK